MSWAGRQEEEAEAAVFAMEVRERLREWEVELYLLACSEAMKSKRHRHGTWAMSVIGGMWAQVALEQS